jgi:hypothetical protein
MDESGIWNDAVLSRTYAAAGSRNSFVACPDKGSRDTIVATLRGDGQKLPLWYIRHTRQKTQNKVVVQQAVKGMTEKLMLQYLPCGLPREISFSSANETVKLIENTTRPQERYIEEVLRPNTTAGQTIFMDQLSSHKTQRVRAKLAELGLRVVYYPPKTAPDLSLQFRTSHKKQCLARTRLFSLLWRQKGCVVYCWGYREARVSPLGMEEEARTK